MARWIRLRVRPGTGLHGPDQDYQPGDEFIVSYADAATLLRNRGRRAFDTVEEFETDSEEPPDGMISIGQPSKPLG